MLIPGEEAMREDYYQVITYMYRYECNQSCLLFPYDGDTTDWSNSKQPREILGKTTGRWLWELGLPIPKAQSDFRQFASEMDAKAKEGLTMIVGKLDGSTPQ
jgi:hypothetical protein